MENQSMLHEKKFERSKDLLKKSDTFPVEMVMTQMSVSK